MVNQEDGLLNSVLTAKNAFEQILEQIVQEKHFSRKETLAYQAIHLAVNSSTGYYSSEVIENVFLTLAQTNHIKLPSGHKKNSFLHVMTEAYATGGHTRVVERWIELSNSNQIHSLLLTNEKKRYIPSRLTQAVKNKQGKLSFLPDKLTNLEKGLQLRSIASEYEYVILHVHMDDVVPLIAFGTTDFKRPVLLFNHADHRFWIGGSIADKIIDFRKWGQKITLNKRGLANSVILGIPIDLKASEKRHNRKELRKKLGIPLDKKLLVTVGSAKKYKPLLGYNFLNVVNSILNTVDKCCFIAIGPSYKDLPIWESTHNKFNNRFFALGEKTPEEMFEYLACADLALDSFPMSGGTALIDAVAAQCPVLSLECPTGQLDYIMDSIAYCHTQEDLIKQIHSLLQSEKACEGNIRNVKEKLLEHNDPSNWLNKLNIIYSTTTKHSIHRIDIPKPIKLTNLDLYLYAESVHIKPKLKIPYIFEWNRIKIDGKKLNRFLLLNRFSIEF